MDALILEHKKQKHLERRFFIIVCKLISGSKQPTTILLPFNCLDTAPYPPLIPIGSFDPMDLLTCYLLLNKLRRSVNLAEGFAHTLLLDCK